MRRGDSRSSCTTVDSPRDDPSIRVSMRKRDMTATLKHYQLDSAPKIIILRKEIKKCLPNSECEDHPESHREPISARKTVQHARDRKYYDKQRRTQGECAVENPIARDAMTSAGDFRGNLENGAALRTQNSKADNKNCEKHAQKYITQPSDTGSWETLKVLKSEGERGQSCCELIEYLKGNEDLSGRSKTLVNELTALSAFTKTNRRISLYVMFQIET